MKKLKDRWGITSNLQLAIILLVFSINGTFAAWVVAPLTEFVGLDSATINPYIYWPIRIILVFVVYQITLPMVGFCLGQSAFFKKFSKNIFCLFQKKK
jgi:hypothetical protein